MVKAKLRAIALISILTLLVFVAPQASLAGGLKGKIQQRLNEPINIQYEPYYSDTDSQIRRSGSQTLDYSNEAFGVGGWQAAPSVDRRLARAPAEREESMISSTLSSYAIYQTDYKAELEDNVVTVKGKAVFQVFREGWTQLPLAKTSVGLIDVSVNRGTAFVVTRGNKYYLMIDKPGRYTLHIEFLIKAKRERELGPGNFSFEVMPAPISQFEFEIPETGVEIFVEPAIKVEVDKQKEKTIAWAVMPNTTSITTRWTKELPKEEIKKVVLEPKVYAETSTYATIGEGIARCETRFDYSILQSEVSIFRIALAEDISLLDVQGRDLRDWKVSKDKDIQYLDVYLNYGVKGKYVLDLVYERNIGEGSVVAEIPSAKAVGIEREKGYFGVSARTNVELAVNKLEHATAIDVKELPSAIWGKSVNPILLAFKYLNHPFGITIDVTRHEELAVLAAAVDSASYVTLHTKEGKILTKATYLVKNTSEQFLRFVLPKGSTLWSTFVSGRPVKPADDKNGSILIPLQKSQLRGETLTKFPVEIVYLMKGSKMGFTGSLKVSLPKISLPISEIFWSVYCPSNYAYFNFGGDVEPAERSLRGWGGLQSRIRDAGDYMVTQSAPRQALEYDLKEEIKKAHKKGVLPIKIDIPQKGRLLQFSKLLVAEKESPHVSMRYTRVFRGIGRIIRFLIFAGIIILIVRGIKGRRRRKREQKVS